MPCGSTRGEFNQSPDRRRSRGIRKNARRARGAHRCSAEGPRWWRDLAPLRTCTKRTWCISILPTRHQRQSRSRYVARWIFEFVAVLERLRARKVRLLVSLVAERGSEPTPVCGQLAWFDSSSPGVLAGDVPRPSRQHGGIVYLSPARLDFSTATPQSALSSSNSSLSEKAVDRDAVLRRGLTAHRGTAGEVGRNADLRPPAKPRGAHHLIPSPAYHARACFRVPTSR